MHLKVERNRGLTFSNFDATHTDAQLFHGTMDVDPRMGSLSWL